MSQPSLYAVIGHPVSHSLSPCIHGFWYDQQGLNAIYGALDLVSSTASEDIRALARAGYSGLNVTLPHKMAAFEAASDMTKAARTIGAINTLTNTGLETDDRGWFGENTDWTGFLWSLDRVVPQLPEGAVLIGAGGAARAVAYALKTRGLSLTLLNRTEDKAKQLSDELDLDVSRVTNLDHIPEVCKGADLVINTVSLGHTGGRLTLPETANGVFVDISYGKAASPTLQAARQAGWQTEDGLPMLIGQAADAFQLWFGTEPDREAALTAARNWTAS